jgi:predicted ATPase/DNA-binding winged helix-turn-helix (wHTH) protein
MVAREAASSNDEAISFGPFRLSPRKRLLLEADKPVRVGSRALDLLIALVERPGQLLSKDQLISRVWPTTHVVEGNLKFQIAALRRALRDGQEGRRYLEASPGQGYRFVAGVTAASDTAPSPSPVAPRTNKQNLPPRLTPLIGRADLIAKLAGRLRTQRLITIVGPGGIGKTSVAIATAEQVIDDYADGVWSVDLSRLPDHAFVGSAVAAAVGINTNPGDPLESLVAGLRDACVLLLLDNCSHVIDAVAHLVTAILKTAPRVHILATSREPLRVEGEHIYRLGPLESPPASERLTTADALRFSAVQLFVDLAAASHDGFELRDEDAPLVGEICHRLDGIPLAIELAAARVDVLGVRGLAARLEDGLQVLTGGHRMALPRHRTMHAALDWSYGLLTPPEQAAFSRLAVFAGGFTLAAVAAVVSDADRSSQEQFVDLVVELATKSLVAADVDFVEPRFRLTETTRAYAIEKCKERGELELLARRHARYYLKLFETVSRDDAEFDRASAALALEINNLRAALRWAFTLPGDVVIGVSLAASSVPLWLSMSLMGEWHRWAERAIGSLDEAKLRGAPQEMIVQATLGMSFQLVKNRASQARAALTRALELAEHLGDIDYQLRILHTFWIYHMRTGEVRSAMALARRADASVASLADPVASGTAEWMLGISLHWVGENEAARRRLEHLIRCPPAAPPSHFIHRFGFDLYVVARYILARILWIQGYPDHAIEAVRASIDEARRLQHSQTLCSALAFGGCAHSLRIGDLDTAERWAAELVGCAQRHSMADLYAYGKAVQEILSLRQGHRSTGAEQFRVALQRWLSSEWHVILSSSDFAEAAASAGYSDEITAIVDKELEWAERNEALSAFPEALRIKGELLLQSDPDPKRAKECFLRSLDCARAQGALSWELRTAVSLARLERTQGRTKEARHLLQSVYDRFTEGFGTSDLKQAKQLLDDLNAASGA